MMPMQNSLAERLSGMGMQPPGPAQPVQTSPQPPQSMSPQSMSPQSTMAPVNNALARPFDPRMMPGQAPVMLPQPVMSGPVQPQTQAQPLAQMQPQAMQAQPMQNNMRRMMMAR